MEKGQIQVGDMIRIEGFGYKHVGIYVGNQNFRGGCVVHNCKGFGVILSTLAEFSGGSEIIMHQQATVAPNERVNIAQRALSLLGGQYDLINFNCEHAAYYAQRGVAESPQIIEAVAGVALIGLIAGAVALLSPRKS